MSTNPLEAGAAFRSTYVEKDLFLFDHACSIIGGDGLFRRLNMGGLFIDGNWYRFQIGSEHLSRAGEWDFRHG